MTFTTRPTTPVRPVPSVLRPRAVGPDQVARWKSCATQLSVKDDEITALRRQLSALFATQQLEVRRCKLKPVLEAPDSSGLKIKYDKLLSSFAPFHRRYIEAAQLVNATLQIGLLREQAASDLYLLQCIQTTTGELPNCTATTGTRPGARP